MKKCTLFVKQISQIKIITMEINEGEQYVHM